MAKPTISNELLEDLKCILKDAKFCGCSCGCRHQTAREQLEDWAIRYMPYLLSEFETLKECHDGITGNLEDAATACDKFYCGADE
jgi:hypothetical protein